MATLISAATGNFTTAATWLLCDATCEKDSENGYAAPPTGSSWGAASSWVQSGDADFQGIALKLYTRAASPTGTVSVRIYDVTAAEEVANSIVLINVSDLPAVGTGPTLASGWVYFNFGDYVSLTNATTYQIEVQQSVASDVLFYRDTTGTYEWAKQLVTVTAQAPAASDKLIVCGDYTGQGTGNSYTVTMNNTADLTVGTTAMLQSVNISCKGTLAWPVSGATTYWLKVKGLMRVNLGGTLKMGNATGDRVAADTTAKLEFVPVANVDSGLNIRAGTFETWGQQPTCDYTTISAEATAAAEHIHTVATTGWKSGWEIVIAGTNRPANFAAMQAEKKTLTVDASGDTVTFTGSALAYTHNYQSGLYAAHVILLTRNVKIGGASATLCGYIYCEAYSNVSLNGTELYYLGSTTDTKEGIRVATGNGYAFTLSYCTVRDGYTGGSYHRVIYYTAVAGATVTVSHVVSYNNKGYHHYVASGAYNSAVFTLDNCVAILNNEAGYQQGMFYVTESYYVTLTNCVAANAVSNGFTFGTNSYAGRTHNKVHTTLEAYSCTATGFEVGVYAFAWLNTIRSWHNNGRGMLLSTSVDINGATIFGNTSYNIAISGGASPVTCRMRNLTLDSETNFTVAYGVYVYGGFNVFENCNFSKSSSPRIAHDSDFTLALGSGVIILRDCAYGAAIPISSFSTYGASGEEGIWHERITGNGIAEGGYKAAGTITKDETYYKTATPAQRLTPSSNNSAQKLTSMGPYGGMKAKITASGTVTVAVWIRKGTGYNGSIQPRLICRSNAALGSNFDADQVLVTCPAGSGNEEWYQLSAATPAATNDGVIECYVDCQGTAGYVTIDDWSVA